MSGKKIVVVFGATGTTGGSVAKYLLEDGTFAVRAVTRNANSDKAKALKAQGAEIVEADLGKTESLPAAVAGAYAVSGLTDFWAVFGTNGYKAKEAEAEEERQGYALVDAAKAAGVKHFVWFNLPHSNVPHFEGKYKIGQHLAKSGVPYTNLYNAFYYENFANTAFGMFKRNDAGVLEVNIPTPSRFTLPSYSADQSGGWVLAILKNPGTWTGKDVYAIGEHITPKGYAEVLTKALGEKVEVKEISDEAFEGIGKSGHPLYEEMYLNMKYFNDHCQPPHTVYDVAESKKIFPGQHNFEEFVAHNAAFKSYLASLKK